jgi:APA family basic amino acid/polyamine antiporter
MSSNRSIWRKKPIAAYEADLQKSELKRVLTRWGLTSLGIGAIIGGGIFTLTGIAANQFAGPALAISFVIAGVGCLFASLCYAEFASVLPVEGSAYAYAYGTVGELFAWFIGWNLVLEYMMGATTVAVSWSGYFLKLMDLIDIHIPLYLSMDYASAKAELAKAAGITALQDYLQALGTVTPDLATLKSALSSTPAHELVKDFKVVSDATELAKGSNLSDLSKHYSSITLPGWSINLPAMIVSWLVTAVLVKGIKEAASTNNLIVILKVAVVLFVIVVGFFYVNTDNWTPFVPDQIFDAKGDSHFGWSGVITAATIVFFAYIGFDAVSTQAGEAINPKKDVPFAIIASLIICTILYILVSFVLTGMVNYSMLDLRAPVASAFSGVGLDWAVYLITIAATAGLFSVMLVMMLGQTRIFLGMAKDGLLPHSLFGKIHPKYKTPYRSTIFVGLIVSVVGATTPINTVSEMCSMGTLLAFAMVCGAVWLLRVKEPNLERPYRTPWLPVVATLGMAFNFFLMTQVREHTWMAFIVWGTIGVIVYFLYSRRNSKLNKA